MSDKAPFVTEYSDIDITDKTILQEQFNYYRSAWNEALKQMSFIGRDIIKINQELIQRKSEIRLENPGTKSLTSLLEEDEKYIELKVKLDSYRLSERIIAENIDMVKNDVQILKSSMYNMF